MPLFKKIKKVTFEDGRELIPVWGEYAIYDGNDIFVVKEEEMSVKIIKADDDEMQIVYSSEYAKHPMREEDEMIGDDYFNIEPINFDDFNDSLCFFDYLDEAFQDLSTCIELIDEKETTNFVKKFTLTSPDGNKFEFRLGIDFKKNNKSLLYVEILKKNQVRDTVIFKTYLNQSNVKKLSKSLLSIKNTINEKIKKS